MHAQSSDVREYIADKRNTRIQLLLLSSRVLYYAQHMRPTSETLVSDLEVGLEVVMAWPNVVEVVVENSDATRPTSRAVTVQYVNHVDRTVDVTEMFSDAPADAHPAVARMRNHQHLADAAPHPEVLLSLIHI